MFDDQFQNNAGNSNPAPVGQDNDFEPPIGPGGNDLIADHSEPTHQNPPQPTNNQGSDDGQQSYIDNLTNDNGRSSDTGDLNSIKQSALQQLTPLVGQLDQSPEEKFKTTMMMIQASDNQSLLKSAYETAQQIQDDKARAQALLDVVNEINYFSQQGQQQ